eukprot:CAMPEP_0175452640 /NCGR_PEP_ID=MMETSP0095-20121207/63516_1 /TAXON_ID=311494 /ORGANISM="Alexandrium monilatum, Strain CCMP3105" /LENGTH=44 /DNA_ID= /DNA_START= /DNA_END= /DNA_ORIENTATION=
MAGPGVPVVELEIVGGVALAAETGDAVVEFRAVTGTEAAAPFIA